MSHETIHPRRKFWPNESGKRQIIWVNILKSDDRDMCMGLVNGQ
jgi:hypothetical protein